jgi:hypothetical protein
LEKETARFISEAKGKADYRSGLSTSFHCRKYVSTTLPDANPQASGSTLLTVFFLVVGFDSFVASGRFIFFLASQKVFEPFADETFIIRAEKERLGATFKGDYSTETKGIPESC